MSTRQTNPGGWVEFGDFGKFYCQGEPLKSDSALGQWSTNMNQAAQIIGINLSPGSNLEGWVRGAGFQNIQVFKHPVPIGMWPKDKRLVRLYHLFRCSQQLME